MAGVKSSFFATLRLVLGLLLVLVCLTGAMLEGRLDDVGE
jgi:hypothetical protein